MARDNGKAFTTRSAGRGWAALALGILALAGAIAVAHAPRATVAAD
jgi:hypothetical protein